VGAPEGGRVLIRRESPADVTTVRAVTAAAFARPGGEGPDRDPPEVRLVDELRASTAWLPRLSLVAIAADGALVGHVLCTRGSVEAAPALALGPLSVLPDHRRRGVGGALVHAALGAADALDEPLVALLGEPRYYSRFGFRLAEEYGVVPPVPQWRPNFQVRTLTAFTHSLRGRFCYPEPFDRV
jgi:putative acetyltransferase